MRYLLALLLLASCSQKPQMVKRPPPRVEVSQAKTEDVPYVIRAIGKATANTSVNIIAQVRGQVTGAFISSGDWVEQGDLMFVIDPRPFEADLEQAQGLLEQAEASRQFSEERVARYSELLPEQFVSKLDFEQYVSDAEEAIGQVDQYKGEVAAASVNVDFTTITAPMSGKLGVRFIDPGNIVSPEDQNPMIVLNQISDILIDIPIPERYLPLVQKYQTKEGLPVKINVPYEAGGTFHGKLIMIDNEVDQASGTILVRATYPNEEKLLWPGQFTDNEIHLYTIKDAVLIPKAAVSVNTKGPFAYVVKKDQSVELRQLEVGQLFGKYQVVNSGIKGGELVVTAGQLALAPGLHVEIAK